MSRKAIAIILVLLLSACQFQPLYGDRAAGQAGGLEQVGANNRATRDAENRAAKEAAEALRLAIASHMNRL